MRRYFWLNIRGLPEHSSPAYTPSGARIVIPQEYFSDQESIVVGSKLEFKDLRASADAVKIKLVDIDGWLNQIFTVYPQAMAKIESVDEASNKIYLSADIFSLNDYVYVNTGEVLQVTSKTTAANGLIELTVSRGELDSVTWVLRKGVWFADKPLLGKLKVELWEIIDGTSQCLYHGYLSELTPSADGTVWTLTIHSVLSHGAGVLQARGHQDTSYIPTWIWGFIDDVNGIYGFVGSPQLFAMPYDDFRSMLQDVLMSCIGATVDSFSLERADDGRLQLVVQYTVTYSNADEFSENIQYLFGYDGVLLIIDDTHAETRDGQTVIRGQIRLLPTGTSWQIGSTYVQHTDYPVILQGSSDTTPADLQGGLTDYSGIGTFLNGVDTESIGYNTQVQSGYRVKIDGAKDYGMVQGVAELPVVRWDRTSANLSTAGELQDYIDSHTQDYVGCLIIHVDEDIDWLDVGSITELLPLSYRLYYTPYGGGSGGILDAVEKLIQYGNTSTDPYTPIFRGLGANWVNVDSDESIEDVGIGGWIEDEDILDVLRKYIAYTTGCVVSPTTKGDVYISPVLLTPRDHNINPVMTITRSNLLAPPEVSSVWRGLRSIEIRFSGEDTYILRSMSACSNESITWEIDADFVRTDYVLQNAARLIELGSTPRRILKLQIETDTELAVGQWIKLSDIPTAMWDGSVAYGLILSVRKQLYSNICDIEVMEYLLDDVMSGYQWGSVVERVVVSGSTVSLYVPISAGVTPVSDNPHGIDNSIRFFDYGRGQWCTTTDSITTASRTSTHYVLQGSTALLGGDVFHSVIKADVNYCLISGDWRSQFRVGRTVRASGSSDNYGTITSIDYDAVNDETTIYVDSWSAGVPAIGDYVWSELCYITAEYYSSATSWSKQYYYYGDPTNSAIIAWYAPGAQSFEVVAWDSVLQTLRVNGDIRPEFQADLDAGRDIYLYFSPPRECSGLLPKVLNISYSAGSTDIEIDCAPPITVGDKFRRAERGRVWRYPRPVDPRYDYV